MIDLVQRLAEAEATIAALLEGQIDAVVDARSPSPVLLSKAQEALRRSEERYRRIVETTREGVWLLDAAHQTTFMNRRMAEMLGCDPACASKSSPFDFLDADEGRKLTDYLQRTDAGQVDIRYTRADGTSVWTLLEAAPVFDADGRYEGSMAMVVDITERKQAEIALRYERDRAESYLDTAEVIMLALDVDARITMINRFGCAVVGWSADYLLGRDWFESCVPVRLRPRLKKEFTNLIHGAGTGNLGIENLIVTRSGVERLVEWRFSVLRDDAGVVVGAITSGSDITERTLAVEQVRSAEERMRFALESAEVGIWDMDYRTGVLSWSPTLERQYGLTPGSFDGTFKSFAALIHPDDHDAALDVLWRAKIADQDFSMHHRIVRPDGTIRSLNGVGRIHLDEQGKPLRGVGISLDVTEGRLLERRYQQSQKMDAIGQLASGVAHDFNNLLTVILGFAEFVTEDASVGDRPRRDIAEIIKAARRAAGLTKQLLAFSRQQVLETVPLDLNKLIADMTAMLRRLIGEHIEISLELAPRLPLALSDRGQLEQVVMNLLVNARDAMPGGGTVTIRTSHVELDDSIRQDAAIVAGHYVLLELTDTGSGMSKETQRRLFEPFYTTKGTGKGTGLGLSTAYGIVKQSHGYIFAESELDRGTTFQVYLPCANAEASALKAAPVETRSEARRSETILLVEDEAAVREFSRRGLEREGYTVVVANNGDEAETMFAERASQIGLLVTDVVMPGCGGPELLARLRRVDPDLRVLFMSGYTELSAANDLRGAVILQKPFTASDLRRRVREVLDRNIDPEGVRP